MRKNIVVKNCSLTLLVVLLAAPFSLAQSTANSPPPVEINLTAKQFEFEPKTITVTKETPVTLKITSTDVEHGFAIDELGIDETIPANATKVIKFTPHRAGRFRFYCSIYCGAGHRQMTGELIVEEQKADAAPKNMQVTFDANAPGVVYVEANGERIRIDTTKREVATVKEPKTENVEMKSTVDETKTAQQEKAEAKESIAEHKREPYDYRLVNLPTPKRVPKNSLNLYFTHRFSEPVRPVHETAKDLLGLDSFSVSSFGLFYGITDKLYVNAYRSPVCQQGLCKTIELGVGYHWLDEEGRSPIALTTYASVEGDDNFQHRFTYNLQAMLARSATKYVNLFFAPAVSFDANGQRRFNPRASDFFPPAPLADTLDLGRNTLSLGFGVNARIRPTVSLLFEYTPRVGFKLGRVTPIFNSDFTQVVGFRNESEAEIGFGIEKDVGRHAFSLTFSNTQTTTTSRYNSSNLVLPPGSFIIGFNLYRRLF
jgi:cytochrome c oxidase subunit 2